MALRIFDFNDFAGIATTKEQGDYELRVYLYDENQTNVDVAIITKHKDEYNLYNFILDKDHLSNMQDINWFHPIEKITLYLSKITQRTTRFLNYALKNKVDIEIITKPF